VSSTISPVRDSRGAISHFIAIQEDVTERKLSQDAVRAKVAELEEFKSATVGRESRMIELKREINALCRELGRPAPYDLAFADGGSGAP
jgi:hypothetical protein